MNSHTTVRVNITIPKNIWDALEKEVPTRGKSSFVATAIADKLRVKKRKKAFADLNLLPATFLHIPDGTNYISTLRHAEDKKRTHTVK